MSGLLEALLGLVETMAAGVVVAVTAQAVLVLPV